MRTSLNRAQIIERRIKPAQYHYSPRSAKNFDFFFAGEFATISRCNPLPEHFNIVMVCGEVSGKSFVDYFGFCPVRFLGQLMKLPLYFWFDNQGLNHGLLSFITPH